MNNFLKNKIVKENQWSGDDFCIYFIWDLYIYIKMST